MANTYFQFKQFRIEQDRCAMKVCTDACLLGSWFAGKTSEGKILDIGSGTGLQMLMLAQKNESIIHGIEIDEFAFGQLKENLASSRWKERLTAYQGDVTSFEFPEKYDFIISNPPFFENDLRSPEESSNRAKHDTTLTLQKLIEVIDRNLCEDGEFGLLLPYHRLADLKLYAETAGFYLMEEVLVKQSPKHNWLRVIARYGRKQPSTSPLEYRFSIRDENNQYTEEFVKLLKDYYLFL